MRRVWVSALFLGLACDSTAPRTDHAGTWALATVNGSAPPTPWVTSAVRVRSGTMPLEANGKFCDRWDFEWTASGEPFTHYGEGGYQRLGDRIVLHYYMTDQEPDTLVYSAAEGTLTERYSGLEVKLHRATTEFTCLPVSLREN